MSGPDKASHFWDRNPFEGWGAANESAGRLRSSEFSAVDLERAASLLATPQPTRDGAEGADDQDPPRKWLVGALRDLARELLADPRTPWIGERDPKQHICWTAADWLESATPQPAPDAVRDVSMAALANRIDLLKPIWVNIPDGAQIQQFVITVSEQDRKRLSVALRSAPVPSPDGARQPKAPHCPNDGDPRCCYPNCECPRLPSATGEPDWAAASKEAKAASQRVLDDARVDPASKRVPTMSATPPVRGDRIIELDAWRPFDNFMDDPLFPQISDEEILTAGSPLTRSKITFGELRELSREMQSLSVRGEREAICKVFDGWLERFEHGDPIEFTPAREYAADAVRDCRDAVLALLPVQPDAGERVIMMPLDLSDEQADVALRATAVWLEVKGSQLTVNREKMKARYRNLVTFILSRQPSDEITSDQSAWLNELAAERRQQWADHASRQAPQG